jgi:hypothetical protein
MTRTANTAGYQPGLFGTPLWGALAIVLADGFVVFRWD